MRRAHPRDGSSTRHEPAPLISRDLSTQIPPVPPKRPPRPWEVAREEQKREQNEALSILQQMAEALGGILNFEKGVTKGDVLTSMAVTIPSNGFWIHQWEGPFAALTVANYNPSMLTVTAMTPQSQAPTVGAGVLRVPGGIQRTVALRGNAVTVYGFPGATFDITAYARPRDPVASRCRSGVFTRVTESTTALGGGGTINGATVDCLTSGTHLRGFSEADQAGTLNLQQSPDGVNWFTTATVATVAATPAQLDTPLVLRYARVQYFNGATAQTTFTLASSVIED